MSSSFREELAAIDILAWLPEGRLDGLASTCDRRILEDGELIDFSTAPDREVYVLLTGNLAVGDQSLTQAKSTIEIIEQGNLFTDPASLNHRLEGLPIAARGNCALACIPRGQFKSLVTDCLEFSLVLAKHLEDLCSGITEDEGTAGGELNSAKAFRLMNAGLLGRVNLIVAERTAPDSAPPLDGAPNNQPLSIEQAEVRGALVLVVENDAASRRIIRHQLNTLGYTAMTANNGREALDLWRARHIALVLTDCFMPEMDGYELCLAIRDAESNLNSRTPVIAVTAGDRDAEDRAKESDMDGLIVKPVDLHEFEKKMAGWLPDAAVEITPSGSAFGSSLDSESETGADLPAIDIVRLSEMMGRNDPRFLAANLSIFLETISNTPMELQTLIENRDRLELHKLAHTAKGAAAIIAAPKLTQLLQSLHSEAQNENWSAIDALAPSINLRFREVEDFIRHFHSGGGA